MTDYTRYFRFVKPDFDAEFWHTPMNATLDKIDATLVNALAASQIIPWENETIYTVGNMLIDVDDGSLWICNVDHTSAALPTTFTEDRAANPTFWLTIALNFQHRGAWANEIGYRLNDIVYDTPLGIVAICSIAHTSSASPATIADDSANWTYIIELATTGVSAADVVFSDAVTGLGSLNVQDAIDDVYTHFAGATWAPLDSPAFTGLPTAPTAGSAINSTQLATTAFVQTAVTALKGSVGAAYDTLAEIETAIALLAPKASPALSGTPTAPTAAPGTSTTQIATTAFAMTAASSFPAGTVLVFVNASAPTGWTKILTINDKYLRVVSGTPSQGGTTPVSTWMGVTSAGGSSSGSVSVTVSGTVTNDAAIAEQYISASAPGVGGTSGTFSGSGSGSSSGSASVTINNNVQYCDVIMATKD